MNKFIACIAIVFGASNAVAADEALQSQTNWSVPDPIEYMTHIKELCKHEVSAALYVAAKRDAGFSRDLALGGKKVELPAGYRLSEVVIENIDDLYKYPDINALTYYTFRGRVCAQEKAQGAAKRRFADVYNQVKNCQSEAKIGPTEKIQNVSLESKKVLAQCMYGLLK